ncbi:MAG: hypothetical protein ACJAT8_001754 [Cellvibrionaceae bacterium]|jgi:hypothetical protein
MLVTFSPTSGPYKQLAYEIRCQIYALNKIGMERHKNGQAATC